VLGAPAHPYTQGLIACLPELGSSAAETRVELAEIGGVVPSIWALGAGCAFRERCPHAFARCASEVPPMIDAGGGHGTACWLQVAGAHTVAA
jgi:peptide/nickel transport system ATP-binding protein